MKILLASALLVSAAANAQALKTDDEKSLYAIGFVIGSKNLGSFGLKPAELEILKRGLTDGTLGKKEAIDVQAQMGKVNEFAQARSHAAADKEKTAGREYAEKAAKESGAQKLPGGTIIKTLKP